jgi:cholesterol transport system auxiliary component
MKPIKTCVYLMVALALTLTLTACTSFRQAQVAKRYYALDVPSPSNTVISSKSVLQIARFRVSPQARGRSLIYRTKDLQYENDYYNEFLVPPENIFTEEARKHITARGLFGSVITKNSLVFPDYVLEGAVVRLYGDFRDPQAPLAVLEMDLFLLKTETVEPKIVFHRTYTKETALEKPRPGNLVAGYSRLAGEIFTEFEDELRHSDVLAEK